MSIDEALREMIRCAGTQFDDTIVEVFIRIPREDLNAIIERFK